MYIEFSNIAGGEHQTRKTLASAAKHAVNPPHGGWKLIDCEGIDETEVKRILVYAEWAKQGFRDRYERMPKTAEDWAWVADTATTFMTAGEANEYA